MPAPPFLLLRVTTLPFETLSALRAASCLPLLHEALAIEEGLAAETAALGDLLHEAAGPAGRTDPAEARPRLAAIALRRDLFNGRPLPLARIEEARPRLGADLTARLEAHDAARRRRLDLMRAFTGAFEADLTSSAEALMAAASQPLVREALRLVSRSLLAAVDESSRREPRRWGHAERHAAAKAAAYLGRFTTKTSPNSLFCATAPADLADGRAGSLVEGENAPLRVDILLNVAEARKIAACLAAGEGARKAVIPRPNPTLREQEGAWTFWRPCSPRDAADDEILSRVKDQPVLRLFLNESSRGTLAVDALLEAVGALCGAGARELEPFFRDLVARGILLAEVEIPYTSRRPLSDLAAACRAAGCEPAWLEAVEAIEQKVARLPGLGHGARIAAMDEIEDGLRSLPHVRPLHSDDLFRLDAASPLRVILPAEVIEELRGAVRWYARFFSAIYPERIYRTAWAARFLSRYPAGREVALLDLYHGLFEPRPARRPSAFPDPAGVAHGGAGLEEAARAMRRARDFFAQRARAALSSGLEEIALDEQDWRDLAGGRRDPSWSSGVLFQVAAHSASDLEAGRYRVVLSALYPGAGMALARLASLHGGGPPGKGNPILRELRAQWSSTLPRDSGGDETIVAEVTYMHSGRTANAGLRPPIFRHEIELPGTKASQGAEAIPLADLVVRFDPRRERFELRSVSRRARVIPVINSGISPEGFVSFLLAVGQQGLQPLALFPGFEVEAIDRWPRFTFGRVVVFRRRWLFAPGEAPEPGLAPDQFFFEAARWRRRHSLPRHLFLHTAADPKPFYVDLESPLFVDLMRRAVAAPAAGLLSATEMLPGPDEMWVAGGRGRYASEFLIHMTSPSLAGERAQAAVTMEGS